MTKEAMTDLTAADRLAEQALEIVNGRHVDGSPDVWFDTYLRGLAAAYQHLRKERSGVWEPIATVPDCDDMLWFARGDTFAGPQAPLGDEADYWDWWCYVKPPSLPARTAEGEKT